MKNMKLIGRGAFTKAYLSDTDGRVYLVTEDPIKECMAHGWFPESELFPKVIHEDNGTYSMEYYPKVRSLKSNLDADQWLIYRALTKINYSHTGRPCDAHNHFYYAFEALEDPELREALQSAIDACSNYGSDVYFEISPRNVSSKNGKLVLMDCFFISSKLNQVRSR